MEITKFCSRCKRQLPLTEEFFYPARKLTRRKIGWQSHCKDCWKIINKENKERRKKDKEIVEV